MKKRDAKIEKTLFSGGVIGRDVITIVAGDDGQVDCNPIAWRDVRRADVPAPSTSTTAASTDAEIDATQVTREAYERGFREGQADAASSAESMIERYDGAIAQLTKALQRTEEVATRDSVRLALRIAKKLVRKAMADDPEALALAVTSAVEHTAGDDPLTVTCDGKTAAGLKLQIDELVSSLGVSKIDVAEDPGLEPGDLMLSRGSTTLDARIETRADRIEQALLRELGLSAEAQG